MYKMIKDGNNMIYNYQKFICDVASDLDNIDVERASSGSTALIIATKELYILNNSKQWELFTTYSGTTGGGGGGIEGDFLDADDVATMTDANAYLDI